MIPFLKNKREGSVSAPVETIRREPDEDQDFDTLDAVASDLMEAIEKKDMALLKAALQSLCDHVMDYPDDTTPQEDEA